MKDEIKDKFQEIDQRLSGIEKDVRHLDKQLASLVYVVDKGENWAGANDATNNSC